MHDDRTIVERRIQRELHERLVPHLYSHTIPFTVEAWDVPGEPVPYAEAIDQVYRPFSVGSQWSRPWGTTWFRFSADVPAEWAGPQLEAMIDLGFHPDAAGFQSEGLVWTDDGPLQGIHPRRTGVPLPTTPAGPFTMVVEAASNPAFPGFRRTPLGSLSTAGDQPLYRLRRADLGVRDQTVYEMLLDFEVLTDLMTALPQQDPRRARLLRTIERALNAIDVEHVGATADAARAILAPALDLSARSSAHRVIGVGHAHIDSAWLWPIRETIRKCARTFASAVRLMDDEPEYRFVCSQAAQYDWMERLYPQLFERISAKVKTGQFVPVGAMWVEADMNLPSGESLVRQMVQGQRYFESRFGIRCKEVWIPDVFGYPATLPQIFSAGGCDRFITQKLSWNKQNRFPHNTFWWEGLDGSRVLTHFPPVDTYNAQVVSREMVFTEHNFQDHGWSDWSLMPYGHGNGGGGPTREMVDRAKRLADLDGAPRLTLGTTDEFFDHLDDEVAAGAPVPVWRGELYFEMHRGTLTSQTRTKVGNRRCERLLREAELWWAAGGDVPSVVADELTGLWRDVLLQQFHDIIPGSSIAWVHEDAEASHTRVAARLELLIADAFTRLGRTATTVANAGSWGRREVVAADASVSSSAGAEGVQVLADGRVAAMVAVPPSGLAAFAAEPAGDRVVTTEHSMENRFLCVRWDLDGTITSIIDVVRSRELLPDGRPIQFQLAPDLPVEYDAWDLESWTKGLGRALTGATTVRFVDQGPLLTSLRVERSFGGSTMAVTYTMRAGSARLDLGIDVDWHEDEKLLSLTVPLDVRADQAACEIQFGHVMRPTHASSPWDAAKFEVCAHRWVDVSEPGFGVAVLNDGRYGHTVLGGAINVTLLRAAKYPDPDADHGRHSVTISILAHGPGLHDVLRQGEALNVPLRIVPGIGDGAGREANDGALSMVVVDHPGVQIVAVKRPDQPTRPGGDAAADDELIVRLHEACGDRTEVMIAASSAIRAATRCNLLEEPLDSLDAVDGVVALTLRPFELVTLRLAVPRR